MFAVYLTIYKGNKLPPFYIGSTSEAKIIRTGYRGSASSVEYKDKWEEELRKFPEKFRTGIVATCVDREDARPEIHGSGKNGWRHPEFRYVT